jgi:hypothetical protein
MRIVLIFGFAPPIYELTLKSGVVVTGIVPHWLWSFISL